MSERSYSHKSDGRQSSAGHSVHSMASGRANSLTGLGPSALMEPPGLAPGLFILGSVPAIIRCWLDTSFKHDTLLYAAVCSGSFMSFVDFCLVEQLGLQDQVYKTDDGTPKIKISVYLPEAVPITGSSRSNSPAPQLPSVAVEFTVSKEYDARADAKSIQIFLGSDMLRSHNADLLFSANQLTIYDDDHCKLQIPLVRPEDERTFKFLHLSSRPLGLVDSHDVRNLTEFGRSRHDGVVSDLSASTGPSHSPRAAFKPSDSRTASPDDGGSSGGRSFEQHPRLGLSTASRTNAKDAQDSSPTGAVSRSGPSPAMLNNWRRDSTEKSSTGSLDWANVGKTTSSSTNYKPRDTGMKVLRPARAGIRTLSTSISSPSTNQSRFFDDGKRRGDEDGTGAPPVKRSVSGEKAMENAALGRPRSANPVGGASAFAWLNSAGGSR
jgi:ubiquitin carboxyl-terminal hydrolase 4/11/15